MRPRSRSSGRLDPRDDVVRQVANLVYGLAEAIDDGDHERIESIFGDATFQLGDLDPRCRRRRVPTGRGADPWSTTTDARVRCTS